MYYTTTPQKLVDGNFRVGLQLKAPYISFDAYEIGQCEELLWSNGMTQVIERHGEKLFSSTWK